jgi:hypothetical protein
MVPNLLAGGILQDRTLIVHADVEQNILDYLAKQANDVFAGGSFDEVIAALEQEVVSATRCLAEARGEYVRTGEARYARLQEVDMAAGKKVEDVLAQMRRWREDTQWQVGDLEQLERERSEREFADEGEIQRVQAARKAEAQEKALAAQRDADGWRARVLALDAAEQAVQEANEELEAAEVGKHHAEMAIVNREMARPRDNGPAFEPWRWEAEELVAGCLAKQARAREAADRVAVAKKAVAAMGMGPRRDVGERLDELVLRAGAAEAERVETWAAADGVLREHKLPRERQKRETADRAKGLADLLAREVSRLERKADALEKGRVDEVKRARAPRWRSPTGPRRRRFPGGATTCVRRASISAHTTCWRS